MTTKKDLIKAIKNNFDINKIYLNIETKDKFLYLNIKLVSPYQSIFIVNLSLKENKNLIYSNLIQIINNHDFSFTLEFEDLNELLKWSALYKEVLK